MKTALRLTIAALVLAAFNLSAATLYVSLESRNPVIPYGTWATAATNIQDAVDAAKDADTVLVTNGVYAVGSRDVGVGFSRVVVTNAIRLESVNGPLVTLIDGGTLRNGGTVVGGVRCAYLGSNAVLNGFTVTNGAAKSMGPFVVITPAEEGGGLFAEPSAVVTNCVIAGNVARFKGGGVRGGTLFACLLSENVAEWRANISDPITEAGYGGGAYLSTLNGCQLTGNSALLSGGGALECVLNESKIIGNSAVLGWGGGTYDCSLINCTLIGNSARTGGGVYESILFNCTVSGNSAEDCAGGAAGGTLYNCIVYDNTAPDGANHFNRTNFWLGTFTTLLYYSCTSPLPTNGVGNIDADPRFVNAAAGDFRLRSDSPCIDAGTNLSDIITTDITGEFRPGDGNRDGVAAFDMGAYEFRPSPVTLYVSLQSTNPTLPYISWATAATNIQDAVDAAKDADTVLVTNGVYAVGQRVSSNRVAITNAITLLSVNGPQFTLIDGGGTNQCVSLTDGASLIGFTITNGNAVPFGVVGGVSCTSKNALLINCVITGNSGIGVYGGTLHDSNLTGNRGGAVECTLYNCTLTGNSGNERWAGTFGCTLYNCTLTNNSGGEGGGAAWCRLYNCTLTGNSGVLGGGAFYATLYNCTLTGNSAAEGGGAVECTLYNCTLTGNSAENGGGGVTTTGSMGIPTVLYNCIVYFNTATAGGANYEDGCTLNYCCITPMPTNGVGNITDPPLFMDLVAGDFRLREGSPCIDAGADLTPLNVGYSYESTDILGNTRFIDGDADGIVAWDIGAYEFNSFKPPRFTAPPERTPEGWKLNITGEPNKWTRIQRNSNLRDWQEIWSGFMPADGLKQITDHETNAVMFYRAVVP